MDLTATRVQLTDLVDGCGFSPEAVWVLTRMGVGFDPSNTLFQHRKGAELKPYFAVL